MRNLMKFKTESDVMMEVYPNLVLIEDTKKVIYNASVNNILLPLYIEALEDITVSFGNTYEYSKNNITWEPGTSETSIPASVGEKVFFRASGLTSSSSSGIGKFTISNGKCNVGGNVMSMLYGAEFKTELKITKPYSFYSLFSKQPIVSAKNLILPATTLVSYCYGHMFSSCASLTVAPELPATTLRDNCYSNMFYNCTSLTTAPELPATTLADGCYDNMFRGCTSLTTLSELPATTLTNYCYRSMFHGCISLTTTPKLPATTLASECYQRMFRDCMNLINTPILPATTLNELCYNAMFEGCVSLATAPNLPATTLSINCYESMFANCTKLINAPELPATKLSTSCYSSMFKNCSSLATAPELPATTLMNSCYHSMFMNCTKLTIAPDLPALTLKTNCYLQMFRNSRVKKIKMLATDISATGCLNNWTYDCPSTGTFIKHSSATWDVTGPSGIPEGWTVEYADA